MRSHRWRRIAAILLLIAGLIAVAAARAAEPVELNSGMMAYSASTTIPATGWHAVVVPWGRRVGGSDPGSSAWVRLPFARPPGNKPLALFSDRVRERYTVYLNGTEIFRSNASATDRSFGWHRPLFIGLPTALLRPQRNEIVIRVEADGGRSTTVGRLLVGDDQQLRREYRLRWFLNVAGPELVSGVIAVLSLGALLFWISRPAERVFGWLALVGLFWCFWNLQYFADSVPFDDAVFWTLNADSMFAVFWAAFGFAATFLDVASRRRIILASAAVCIGAIAIRHILIAIGSNPAPSYLIMWPLAFATLYLLGGAIRRSPSIENIAMFGAMTVSTAFGFHDLVLLSTTWRGVDLPAPALWRPARVPGVRLRARAADAGRAGGGRGRQRDPRTPGPRCHRQARPAARQRAANFEVGNAVDLERERMMREIHDGIGSSLITALAVAQRERQSPNTIATLQRSISDLQDRRRLAGADQRRRRHAARQPASPHGPRVGRRRPRVRLENHAGAAAGRGSTRSARCTSCVSCRKASATSSSMPAPAK